MTSLVLGGDRYVRREGIEELENAFADGKNLYCVWNIGLRGEISCWYR